MQESFDHFKTPRQKILWLENGEILGGAELFSLDMFSFLGENFSSPVEIVYAYEDLHSGLKEHIEQIQKILPAHISLRTEKISLPQLREISGKNIWKTIKASAQLRKKIREEKFQYVHANTVRTGFLLSLAGIFLDTKKSFFAHDYTAPKKWLKYGSKVFQKIFACSYPIKNFVHQAGVPYDKIHVIENGVDEEKFLEILQKKNAEKTQKKLIQNFGIIGRIAPWKGQLTVLKAIENLLEEYGRAEYGNLHFHFFGEASDRAEDQEYFERLQHFVSENSLEKNVTFHGFTPLLDALKISDAIIHASEEAEPFGRTPLEGAICEKPVFISNMGTPAQIFEDGKNALFFEPKDAEMLSEKILWAIQNPEKTSEISQNGKKMVAEKFALNLLAKNFWKQLISS